MTVRVGLDVGATKCAVLLETTAGVTAHTVPSTGWNAEPVEYAATWILAIIERVLPAGVRLEALAVGAQGLDNPELARGLAERITAGGCIINMVDLLAERPWAKLMYYCSTKAALLNLTMGLAKELSAKQIRVNGIAPGPIEDTEGMKRLLPDALKEKITKKIPLGRFGRIADIENAALFLTSDAASYINGVTLVVDGGLTLAAL